jgi:hypothetical protein
MERLYDQMSAMQAQISALTAAVHSLAQNNNGLSGAAVQRPDACSRPYRRFSIASKEMTFQGPTTSGFSFDLAKSSLKERGIEVGGEGDMTREPSPLPTPPSAGAPGHSGDPLWDISKTEALRLCKVYEEEMGVMYPVVELSDLLKNVDLLYGPAEVGFWPRAPIQGQNEEGLDNDEINILRLVFACALTAEASGNSDFAMSLFETVRDAADHYVWAAPEIKSITLLALVVSRISGHVSGANKDRRYYTSRLGRRRWPGELLALSTAFVWKKGFIDERRLDIPQSSRWGESVY